MTVSFPSLLLWVLAALLLPIRPLGAVDEVRAGHILVRSEQEALKALEEIRAQGGDLKAFTAACRKYSKDPTTKPLGGDVGYFPRRGRMEASFADAAFGLQVGEISRPVKSNYGWHLIYCIDRRDRTAGGQSPAPTPPLPDGTEGPPLPGPVAAETGGTAGEEEQGESTGAAGETGAEEAAAAAARAAAVAADTSPVAPRAKLVRPRRQARNVSLVIESIQARYREDVFYPTAPVELRLALANEGSQEVKVPAPGLVPLGFRLTRHADGREVAAYLDNLSPPESYFISLEPGELEGATVVLNDYFEDLPVEGRYRLEWDGKLFVSRLEKKFPNAAEVAGYEDIKTALSDAQTLRMERVHRDRLPHWGSKRQEPFSFGILDRPTAEKKYYARLKLARIADPVYIELDTKNALRAVEHFMRLALVGFYDQLIFYEVQEGDYLVGGSPTGEETGAPSMRLPRVRNDAGLAHERGTVSLVSRSLRSRGPVKGGEVGSIFFVCLKPHPEWNDEHVPFGKVVSGLEALEKATRANFLESVTILAEREYLAEAAGTDAETGARYVRGDPEAVITTAKGEFTVALFEDAAPNTVASFISLAEKGFFDKTADGTGKQIFFEVVENEKGKVALQAGSPTNDDDGGPEYKIPDEVNDRDFKRGTLFMAKLIDPESNSYVPQSAGSQFYVCLQDVPYFRDQGVFTAFGQVTSGLEVLDKLEKGDAIESVKITQKRRTAYQNFRKVRN